jgi:hypothetical protein
MDQGWWAGYEKLYGFWRCRGNYTCRETARRSKRFMGEIHLPANASIDTCSHEASHAAIYICRRRIGRKRIAFIERAGTRQEERLALLIGGLTQKCHDFATVRRRKWCRKKLHKKILTRRG